MEEDVPLLCDLHPALECSYKETGQYCFLNHFLAKQSLWDCCSEQ